MPRKKPWKPSGGRFVMTERKRSPFWVAVGGFIGGATVAADLTWRFIQTVAPTFGWIAVICYVISNI